MPGQKHYEHFVNRQDMFGLRFIRRPDNVIKAFSLVFCDGCSEGETSEAGAALISQMAALRLVSLVQAYGLVPDLIGKLLYAQVLEIMRKLIGSLPYGAEYLVALDAEKIGGPLMDVDQNPYLRAVYDFIQRNLLFAFIAVYSDVSLGTLVLQRGDGGYVVDDEVQTLYYHDVAPYIAYDLFPQKKLDEGKEVLRIRGKTVTNPEPGFIVKHYPRARRVAVFTDGLLDNKGQPLTAFINSSWELLDPIERWDYLRNMLQHKLRQMWKASEISDDDVLYGAMEWVLEEVANG